jgi:hypothetical protein
MNNFNNNPPNIYMQGAEPLVTAEFRNSTTGVLTDPNSVTLEVSQEGVVVYSYTYGVGGVVVKDDVGLYHANLDTTAWPAGTWWYTYIGTGAATAINAGFFIVIPRVPNS